MPWSPLMSPCFTSDGNLLKARRASESYTNDYSRSLIVLTVSNMEQFRMNFPTTPNFWHVPLPALVFLALIKQYTWIPSSKWLTKDTLILVSLFQFGFYLFIY